MHIVPLQIFPVSNDVWHIFIVVVCSLGQLQDPRVTFSGYRISPIEFSAVNNKNNNSCTGAFCCAVSEMHTRSAYEWGQSRVLDGD